jgi:opacity protein-like surface antigen
MKEIIAMRKFLMMAGLTVLFGAAAQAQDVPVAELYGGYQYARLNDLVPPTLNNTDGIDAQGFNFQGVYNVNRYLGVVADFGASFSNGGPNETNLFTYTFGPRVSLRNDSRVTPFAQVLFGGARASDVPRQSGRIGSANGYAMLLGGGLDVKVNEKFSIRPFQADFLLTRVDTVNTQRENQTSLRLSFGVNFKLGKR